MWDLISGFNGGLFEPPLKLVKGWVITSSVLGVLITYPFPISHAGVANLCEKEALDSSSMNFPVQGLRGSQTVYVHKANPCVGKMASLYCDVIQGRS